MHEEDAGGEGVAGGVGGGGEEGDLEAFVAGVAEGEKLVRELLRGEEVLWVGGEVPIWNSE